VHVSDAESFVFWVSIPDGVPVKVGDIPRLVSEAMHPDGLSQAVAEERVWKDLQRLVNASELIVKDPLTLGPHEFPVGDGLRRAVLLPYEIRGFLAARGIGLHLVPHGSGPLLWTLENAAAAVAAQQEWHKGARDTFLAQMMQAARDALLTVRHPHTDLPYKPETIRPFYELVTRADVNAWLHQVQSPLTWREGQQPNEAMSVGQTEGGPSNAPNSATADEPRWIGHRTAVRAMTSDGWLYQDASNQTFALDSQIFHGVSMPDIDAFIERLEAEGAPAGHELRERRIKAWEGRDNHETFLRHMEWIVNRKREIELAEASQREIHKLRAGRQPNQPPHERNEQAKEPAAPASSVESYVDESQPAPVSTGHVAFSFAGLKWKTEEAWKKPLADKPKWLLACVAVKGQRGVRETLWNPVLIGAALVRGGHAKQNSVRSRFQTREPLKPWLEAWKTYEADNLASP
jgi:hypothetical protein